MAAFLSRGEVSMAGAHTLGDGGSKAQNLRVAAVDPHWHVGLPIYACREYLELDGSQAGWVGGTDQNGELRCVLPFYVIRKPGFQLVRFRTQTIALAGELGLEEEKAFLSGVVGYFRSSGADLIIPSGNTAIFRVYPDGAVAAPYGTFIKDLSRPEENLFSEIRKTYRQNIRKAIAAGVQVKSGPEYLDNAYQLTAETLKRSGSKFKSYSEFKRTVLALGKYVKIFVAEHEGVIQGCLVAPFSAHTAYNCYAGSRAEPVLGSMHLLHWEAIRHFRDLGVKRFDFQGVRINPDKGSKQEGIANYKQGFGGQLVQGFVWRYPLRPWKSLAYSAAMSLLKGGDFVDKEQARLSPPIPAT
jgi:hypothetical protein